MKETKIMKVFEKYMRKFDMNKGNVKMMYFHSIKVAELCKEIATNLKEFTEEEILVCEIIGLFHGIASISNKNSNYTFDDTIDYNKKSAELLFGEDELMRQITSDTKYDDVIKVAIYCQNKTGLPKGIDEKSLHYCKVLKDAHVIDEFRMNLNYPLLDIKIDDFPSDLVYNEFKKYHTVTDKVTDNDADIILKNLSNIFSLNYSLSYKIIYEEQYITKIINILTFKNKNIFKFFKQINIVLNNYIKRKIGD